MTRIHVKSTGIYSFNTPDGTHHLSGPEVVKWRIASDFEEDKIDKLAEIVGRLLEHHVPVDEWLAVCQPYDLEQVK